MAAAKNYSKGAKRRAKKNAMPELAKTPRREKDGRVKRSTRGDYERSPEDKVLRARARHMGKPEQEKSDMNNGAFAFPAGKAIYSLHDGAKAARLWDAFTRLTDAEAGYLRHKAGLSVHAKTAKLEMLPERFEHRDDHEVDTRSDEEKYKAAANRWMYWRGLSMHIKSFQRALLFDVAYGRVNPMKDGNVTPIGGRFVEALEAFAKVVESKK